MSLNVRAEVEVFQELHDDSREVPRRFRARVALQLGLSCADRLHREVQYRPFRPCQRRCQLQTPFTSPLAVHNPDAPRQHDLGLNTSLAAVEGCQSRRDLMARHFRHCR